VKAGGKQSNRLAEILGNRKEMEYKNSIPIDSPEEQDEENSTHSL
jgi:hypothetical protein